MRALRATAAPPFSPRSPPLLPLPPLSLSPPLACRPPRAPPSPPSPRTSSFPSPSRPSPSRPCEEATRAVEAGAACASGVHPNAGA
eukprot:7353540-Prymnesium_polylepis.1